MTNLFKCLTCNKTLTTEESGKHHCRPTIKKHRIIQAPSYFTVIDDNGIENVVIDGLDHIGYIFEIVEPKLTPLELPCDVEHPNLNTEKFYVKHPEDEQILISTSVQYLGFVF